MFVHMFSHFLLKHKYNPTFFSSQFSFGLAWRHTELECGACAIVSNEPYENLNKHIQGDICYTGTTLTCWFSRFSKQEVAEQHLPSFCLLKPQPLLANIKQFFRHFKPKHETLILQRYRNLKPRKYLLAICSSTPVQMKVQTEPRRAGVDFSEIEG